MEAAKRKGKNKEEEDFQHITGSIKSFATFSQACLLAELAENSGEDEGI